MNRIQEKFLNKELSVGTFTQLASPVAVECLGRTGLDYVLIDTEHTAVGIEFLTAAITAADAAGIVPLVRINGIARDKVLQPLDYGAQGLIIPAVETVEEVRRLVEYAKFPPLGSRGFCPTRDGGWGYDAESLQGTETYFARCNRETLLIPQCETAGCLAHIEEITAMDGVDGIFVGPFDLSIALGRPLEFDCPEMRAAMDRILTACHVNNKMAFIFCGDAQTARKRAAEGYDSVTTGLDALALVESYRAMVREIRD
ncbi:HpcH/HpaI aldolase/citrate lyase family protein [uncultured Oscillibacter sp.]|uniref:HpcH/HpaI aldolase family protein n=1 Tax=uncultured Oscillibacter sp. TaxID=876091 RepID=UPI0025D3904E|nr:aldolase/citrate lyase family protein [uncultured Oscillibacter sp.]